MSEGLKTIIIQKWGEGRPIDNKKAVMRMPHKGGYIISAVTISDGTARVEATNTYMSADDIPPETEWFYAAQARWE